jgi:xylulokinase
MTILGLDVGSSSIKAGIVRQGRIVGRLAVAGYSTRFDGAKAEVDPEKVLVAIARAIGELGERARRVDAIGLSVMGPAWVAMDSSGKAITPIVTHQDRRSVAEARELLDRVGEKTFLRVAGNLPFPGSMSVTNCAWYAKHQPNVIRQADLIGHLNTFLHRQFTGARVIDPSNASFTGMYETMKLGGWSKELCDAAGVEISKLPEIVSADRMPGKVTNRAAGRFGMTAGTPVFTGLIDTGAALMLWGPREGQLINVSGSTDVLMLCTTRPRPHPKLLTRALGVGDFMLSVSSIAAAGSSIHWMKEEFFREMSEQNFYRLVSKLARIRRPPPQPSPGVPGAGEREVVFEPYLAGDRASIQQKRAAFHGLTLSTRREQMLLAVIDALAKASGERLKLLKFPGAKMRRTVFVSGGTARVMGDVLHRDWPGKWKFDAEGEASLRGLSCIEPKN